MSFFKKQNNSQKKLTNYEKDLLIKKLISEIPKPKNQKIKKQYETIQIKEKKENEFMQELCEKIKKQNKKNLNESESIYSTSTNTTTITNCISERIIKVPQIFYKKKIHKTSFSSNKNKNINNENINNINYNNNNSNKNILNLEINLEDLLLIEEKFSQIKDSFNQIKNIKNEILQLQIYEWWNFYFNCSINGYIEKYFLDNYSHDIIHFYTIIQFAFIMILYNLCFIDNLIERNKNKINSVLNILQNNYFLICQFILTKINTEYINNLWVEKINILLKNQLKENYGNNNNNNINQIKINNKNAYNIINDILLIIHVIYDLNNEKINIDNINNLQNPNSLFYLYNTFYDKEQDEILSITNEQIKLIFFRKIYQCSNPKSSQVPANLQLILSEKKLNESIITNETNDEINAQLLTYENEEITTLYNNDTKRILTNPNLNSNYTFEDELEENNINNNNNKTINDNYITNKNNNKIINNKNEFNNIPNNINRKANKNNLSSSYNNIIKNYINLFSLKKEEEIIEIPFLKKPSLKKLTLVLDLDETMISFLMTNSKTGEGKLRLRPYLKMFLEEISKIYEIVIFTAGTKDYADPILDIIEKDKKFFSFRLYRNHTIVMGNYYIKDISRLGRDLDKVIIVDNMPQNFRLQKDNGILISSFFGEDENDNALFNLKKVLVRIYEENDDVRNCIRKYKNEIIRKISSKCEMNFAF